MIERKQKTFVIIKLRNPNILGCVGGSTIIDGVDGDAGVGV